jgi:hypothetical protein
VRDAILATGLLLADLNEDGRPDIIETDGRRQDVTGSRTIIFLSNALGNYSTSETGGLDYPGSLSAADVDGDGHVDLIIANGLAADVVVRLSKGVDPFAGLSFETDQHFLVNGNSFHLNMHPAVVAGPVVADFDGDGRPDIAAATYHSQTEGDLRVLRNTRP